MDAFMLGLGLKSFIVLGAAGMVALIARQRSAAARHLVWTAAMVALLALPMLSVSLPSLHFRAADRVLGPSVTFVSEALSGADATPAVASKSPARSTKPAPWKPDWGMTIAAIWAAGTIFGCARLMLAWMAMWRLRSASISLDEDLTALSRELDVRQEVQVLGTAAGAMPMMFGWRRPTIFLPSDTATWSEERKRAVLLHELAHVRRGDAVTQVLARIALCMYWWNPLAWTAWREFLKMRERAADDLVLDAGTRACDYAGHLVDVARLESAPAMAVGMAQASQLEGRVLAILDARVNRKSPGKIAAVAIALAAMAVVVPVAAIHAQDTTVLPADVDATIRAATSQKNFDMLDRVAAGFAKIGKREIALKMLESALAVRADVAGDQSATYADGLIKLGDLEKPRKDAKDYYEKAVALGDRPATVPALMYLSIVSMRAEPAKALEYLQRSINADPKGTGVAEAMAWMGTARALQGDTAEAESLLSRAASMATDSTPEHALILEMYAQFLGETPEAKALQARAFEIRKEHLASLSPKSPDGTSALRIGGSVLAPTVASKAEPEYSTEARVTKTQGQVEVHVTIGTDGIARDITLVKGIGYGLDEKALEALVKWRFHPATSDGLPVPVIATIQINFRLL